MKIHDDRSALNEERNARGAARYDRDEDAML